MFGVNQTGRDVVHAFTSIAEAKNAWLFPYTTPVRPHDVYGTTSPFFTFSFSFWKYRVYNIDLEISFPKYFMVCSCFRGMFPGLSPFTQNSSCVI